MFVCLFVCPLAYLKNYSLNFVQILCTCKCYLWPWLSRPLLRTSGFVDDVMFTSNEGNRLSKTTRMLRAEYCIVGIPHNTAI